jgi:uncharacterized membrane protein
MGVRMMGKILGSLNSAIALGVALLLVVMFGLHFHVMDAAYAVPVLVFLHVLSGIVWIGLLYYFNLVQIPTMPKVPAELKGGVSKFIAPEALWWFRWGAIATLVTGLGVAGHKGYLIEAFTLRPGFATIGVGMYIAIIMAANVWMIIWPNQQRALGLVPADDATKAASARTAMLASRTNFVLSFPMLYAMVTQLYLGGAV